MQALVSQVLQLQEQVTDLEKKGRIRLASANKHQVRINLPLYWLLMLSKAIVESILCIACIFNLACTMHDNHWLRVELYIFAV